MMIRSSWVLLSGVALSLASVSAGHAESAWRIRHGNGGTWAEASSLSHGSTLSLQCDDTNNSIALILEPPASWNGDAGYTMKLLVDGTAFPVIADGTDDGVILSNLPREAIGIDLPLRRAMKGGHELVIEGPPAAGITLKQRSFSLGGASTAITRIESGCPGVR